ncbi:TRPM8 channel-associated factor homolog [Anomaloglossus baeobatrachus]|uniref:TRPM8 channel-associated factor homolog n=1 Tax=Anomaloglossus baeobatrachus TaxID=238106 RepID=UPI003F4F5322
MSSAEDYKSLVKGIKNLDFSGTSVPCSLLLIGDTAFPVVVSPAKHVLIAASRYGEGRIIVMSHETYLDQPQFMDFLKNAISWLQPYADAVIGIDTNFSNLETALSESGFTVEKTSGLKEDLGVLCTSGYEEGQIDAIISFLKGGGGLLIGAQPLDWASQHNSENVLFNFPGNKLTSVAGVYFTGSSGEKENLDISDQMPLTPWYNEVDFSADQKIFLQGVTNLDISGASIPSEMLLHGPLTFPLGITDNYRCFAGAAFYGRGRVVVEGHASLFDYPKFKTFTMNILSWLDMGRNGRIGVHKDLKVFAGILQKEGIPYEVSDFDPGLSVYCCTSYSDRDGQEIQQFVAEGGGLLIGGQAWYWSYSNPDVVSQYPGNKIINTFGITLLSTTVSRKLYQALDPEASTNTYQFLKALDQLLRDLKSGAKPKPPLSSWLMQLRNDAANFMKLPGNPLISSIKQELADLVHKCDLPNVSTEKPVKSNSKESLILSLAFEVGCLDDPALCNFQCAFTDVVTVQIDATNNGDNAWRSTGLYLPPKKAATFIFPSSALEEGLQVQVGCHSDDLSSKKDLCRAPVVVYKKNVVNEKVVISSAYGGLLYVIVKGKSQLGIVPVTVYGAQPAPTFIKGQTKLSSWLDTIRNYPTPWAELITENIILTVPSDAIRSLDDPEALLSQWDIMMNAVAELAMIPKKFPRPERIVTDVQISVGLMHAGYPIMCHIPAASHLVNLQVIKKDGIWGPIHELGHNQQQSAWEFPSHTTEATCNLWSVYVHENVLGIPRAKAHSDLLPEKRENRTRAYLKNGANLKDWSMWTALETYLQLQECFGWDPFKRLFADYQTMPKGSNDNKVKMNLWAEKFSQAVNKNLSPFFKAWGWPIDENTSQKLSTLSAWEEDPMKTYAETK